LRLYHRDERRRLRSPGRSGRRHPSSNRTRWPSARPKGNVSFGAHRFFICASDLDGITTEFLRFSSGAIEATKNSRDPEADRWGRV
jgi:hypothetical protein